MKNICPLNSKFVKSFVFHSPNSLYSKVLELKLSLCGECHLTGQKDIIKDVIGISPLSISSLCYLQRLVGYHTFKFYFSITICGVTSSLPLKEGMKLKVSVVMLEASN